MDPGLVAAHAAGRAPARLLIPAVIFPLVSNTGNIYRYGVLTLIYALLAYGLTIVVGFAGLLDLGYIAFFGFGAYAYGFLASQHTGRHWQALVVLPIVVIAAAVLGIVLGSPSLRLLGDYLAIVTLFFGQAFVLFANNANRIDFPFFGEVDLTGGSHGPRGRRPARLLRLQGLDEQGLLLRGPDRCCRPDRHHAVPRQHSRGRGARGGRCARTRLPPR